MRAALSGSDRIKTRTSANDGTERGSGQGTLTLISFAFAGATGCLFVRWGGNHGAHACRLVWGSAARVVTDGFQVLLGRRGLARLPSCVMGQSGHGPPETTAMPAEMGRIWKDGGRRDEQVVARQALSEIALRATYDVYLVSCVQCTPA